MNYELITARFNGLKIRVPNKCPVCGESLLLTFRPVYFGSSVTTIDCMKCVDINCNFEYDLRYTDNDDIVNKAIADCIKAGDNT